MNGKFSLIITLIVFLTLFLIPLRDTDFGWHFRCGQMIVENHKLCHVNNFTTLLKNYVWHSPSQGYQLLIFLLYKNFGFAGISLFYALSAAFVLTFFLCCLSGNFYLKTGVGLALLWFSWSVWQVGFRSQIISFYFFAIFLALLELSKKRKKVLFFIPPLIIIWSNSHPGFFLGSLLMIFWLIENLVNNGIYKRGKNSDLIFPFIVSALSLLATLINPYGINIYFEVLRHTQVPLNTLIAEWVAPPSWISFAVIILSFAAFLELAKHWPQNIFRLLLIILVTLLAVEARRNLPLYSLGLTFALLNADLASKLDRLFNRQPVRGVMSAVFLAVIFFNARQNLPVLAKTNNLFYCQNALVRLPCESISFMKEQRPGNIFNAYEWGGFLDWQLPNFRIFVDGRMPTWDTASEENLPKDWRGQSPYTIYLWVLQTQPGWQAVLKNYKINYLIIQPGTFLDLELKENATKDGFAKIYNDGAAAIYKKI